MATSKGKEFAEKNNMIFYEVSAKTGSGINELFLDIGKKTYICEKKIICLKYYIKDINIYYFMS